MARDDGGPAFPGQAFAQAAGACEEHQYGITLRDWFAGQVLVGLTNDPKGLAVIHEMAAEKHEATPFVLALICYAQADAMLQARKDGEG